MGKTLIAEQNLLNGLRAAARYNLGPEASDAEVEAEAREAYEGPKQRHVPLTRE